MRLDEEVFEFDREDDEIESEYDTENVDAELSEQAQRQLLKEQQLIDELEADAAENPIEDDRPDEDSERKKLKRELQAEALARLEDAARTVSDFEKVVAWWDKLDANRERRERYHELSRSGDDLPFDYGMAKDGLFFPDTLNNVLEKLIRKVAAVCNQFPGKEIASLPLVLGIYVLIDVGMIAIMMLRVRHMDFCFSEKE